MASHPISQVVGPSNSSRSKHVGLNPAIPVFNSFIYNVNIFKAQLLTHKTKKTRSSSSAFHQKHLYARQTNLNRNGRYPSTRPNIYNRLRRHWLYYFYQDKPLLVCLVAICSRSKRDMRFILPDQRWRRPTVFTQGAPLVLGQAPDPELSPSGSKSIKSSSNDTRRLF